MKFRHLYLYLLVTVLPLGIHASFGNPNPYCAKQELPSHMDVNIYLETLQVKGMGYNTGYSTVAFQLFPNAQPAPKSVWFIDARFHYFNDNKWAANLGFASRKYSECLDAVIGVNAFYDFRQIHDEYHQVGLGLEYLGRRFALRLNGYLPVAHTKFFGNSHRYNYPGGFFAECQGIQRALPGADAELYTSLWQCGCGCNPNFDPYVGIGPYYYFHRKTGSGFWGGRARVGTTIGKRCTIEARGSHDKVYGTIIQGYFSINFSLGGQPIPYSAGCCYDPCIDEYLHEPIQRQEIIIDSKRCCHWNTNY